MTKYLGIDYGLERTGLAISDPGGVMAFPLATLRLAACKSRSALLDRVAELARANNAEAIVMGLPLDEDGSENLRCRQTRNFAARLERRVNLPVHFVSEYLSTQAARAELASFGKKGAKLARVLDQQAACLILESFMAGLRADSAPDCQAQAPPAGERA